MPTTQTEPTHRTTLVVDLDLNEDARIRVDFVGGVPDLLIEAEGVELRIGPSSVEAMAELSRLAREIVANRRLRVRGAA